MRRCKKKKDIVIKPNNFTELISELSPSAIDVLDILLSSIDIGNIEDLHETECIIYTTRYEGLLEDTKGRTLSHKSVYNHIKKGIDELYRVDIQIDHGDVQESFRVFSAKASSSGNGILSVFVTPRFQKLLRHELLTGGKTMYDIRNQLVLKGKCAKRLYPMLVKYKNTGWRRDNADILKKKLAFSPSLDQSKYIKNIETAIDEINEATDLDISVTYEKVPVRGGSKVKSIKFNIKKKRDDIPVRAINDEDECLRFAAELMKDELSNKDILAVTEASEYNKDLIQKAYDHAMEYRSDIDNLAGFMIASIKGDWKQKKKRAKNKFDNFTGRSYSDDDMAMFEEILLAKPHKD